MPRRLPSPPSSSRTSTRTDAVAVMTYREALNLALREEMRRDPRVFVMGEEVGLYEGAYKVTQGLLKEFGVKRIIDTPICESGFTGVGVGAAMLGRGADDLIEGEDGEVERHHRDHGPQAQHGRPHPHPRDAGLADGRVDDALLPELLEEALGHLVGAVVEPDLFAHDEHARVAAHLLAQGEVEGFAIGHDGHGINPCRRP